MMVTTNARLNEFQMEVQMMLIICGSFRVSEMPSQCRGMLNMTKMEGTTMIEMKITHASSNHALRLPGLLDISSTVFINDNGDPRLWIASVHIYCMARDNFPERSEKRNAHDVVSAENDSSQTPLFLSGGALDGVVENHV